MNTSLTMDLAIASQAASPENAARQIEYVKVGDREVRIDIYGGGSQRPTILLLHGAGGLLSDGALLRRMARDLAQRDFRVCVVHYFNATGTLLATQAGTREHFDEWRRAIQAVAKHYAAESGGSVGVFGLSIGGVLAASAAADTPEIEAITIMAGGIMEGCDTDHVPEHVPAVLILHGDHDTKFPPDRAEALARIVWHANGFVDTVMYPNEGHTFGARAEKDARRRVMEFFDARLGAGVYR